MEKTDQCMTNTSIIDAFYGTDGLPQEFIGNPLIEALPRLLTHEEVVEALRRRPAFHESERSCNNESRLFFISRLFWQFYQPLEQHIRIWDYLSLCIRQGYLRRNPLSMGLAAAANEIYIASKEKRTPQIPSKYIPSTVGFAVIGVSRVGKSSAIDSMLHLYPQVIHHHEYKGEPLEMKQIVWLKLDCSLNGSERGFCLSFLSKVDQLVGTSYYDAYKKRATADTLLTQMQLIAHNYSLGVLLVDEIQHLANAKQDSQKLLNFFVTLENTIGVPVVLLGTPGALSLLQGEFRAARRCCAHGDIFWNPLQWDRSITNSEWEMFLNRMWKYQWIRNPTNFKIDFIEAMYEETQGIEALAVILFMLLQEEAIRSGTETITVDDIKRVARKQMAMVQPMLEALRSKDQKKIARYSDIISLYVGDIGSAAKEKAEVLRQKETPNEAAKTVASYLCEMGLRPEEAEKYAKEGMKADPEGSMMMQVKAALSLYLSRPALEGDVNAEGDEKDLRNFNSYQEIKDSLEADDE